MPEGPLDAALDELYASDPGDFVATRKRLATDLRAAGDTGGAKELQAARRPSTAAWALNQLARREADLVDELLERSSELQAAQTRAGSGPPETLREAMRAHRTALDQATAAALAILGDRANDGFRSEIVSTLRSASAEADTGGLLRAGRLIREAEFQGFPEATGLTLVPQPADVKPRAAAKPETRDPKRSADTAAKRSEAAAAAEAARAARERQTRHKANVAARKVAMRKAEAAEANAARAQARVEQLHNELDLAERAWAAARERNRVATDDVARLDAAIEADSES
jgi:hypothetical protein